MVSFCHENVLKSVIRSFAGIILKAMKYGGGEQHCKSPDLFMIFNLSSATQSYIIFLVR